MTLCRYRDALGVPRRGVHAARFMSMALNDWLMTFLGALLLTWIFYHPRRQRQFWTMYAVVLITLVGLGIILHRMFCVRTTVDRWLFGDE